MQITAAIARAPGAPYQIGKLELAAPGPHEVIVRLAATGICMTDVHGRDGYYGTPLPCVFGHEGAGVVEQIGSAVTGVAQGDHVVMVSPGCGACVHCAAKLPGYCVHARQVKFSGLLRNGAAPLRDQSGPVYGAFFQQSSFATYALALESNTIGVPKHFAFEHLAAFPCGVNTGAGAVMNVLKPRAGESFAVFGVGTVGLAGMLAAKIAGCDPIIAIDLHDNRLALARELGATHVINAAHDEPVASIQRITGRGRRFARTAASRRRTRADRHRVSRRQRSPRHPGQL